MTLDADNLLWLRAQSGAGRSVSRIVDEIVGDARASGHGASAASRSVVGTVDLRGFDPTAADRDLRSVFNASVGGNATVYERRARYERKRRQPRS